MIAPTVSLRRLDPVGFAWLNAVVGRRDQRAPAQLTVVHAGDGTVLRVLDAREGLVDRHRATDVPTDDVARAAHARTLLDAETAAGTGIERVVLLDQSRLGDLTRAVNEIAKATPVQSELLRRAGEQFWSHPAVATAPEPPASPWPPVAAALRSLPNGAVLLGVYDGDDPHLLLLAVVEGGLVTRVTSPVRPWPPRSEVAAWAAQPMTATYDGLRWPDVPTVAALVLDRADAEVVLLDPTPLARLQAVGDEGRLVLTHGLEVLA